VPALPSTSTQTLCAKRPTGINDSAKMTTNFWIEKAWGDSVDNATMDDIKVAIRETTEMDDEHGAFWVGNNDSDNHYIMEIRKDLMLFFNINDNPKDQLAVRLHSWAEVESLYRLFLDNHYEQIEREIKQKVN
jgi:hypothetical protein